MDIELSLADAAFRDEVRAFLAAELPEAVRAGAAASPTVFVEPDVGQVWNAVLNAKGWLGPYAKESALKDPWNTPYEYRVPGDGVPFVVISYGNDKKPGGTGVDRDVTSAE